MKKIILALLIFSSCSTDRTLNRGSIITGVAFAGIAKASKFTTTQSIGIGITSAILIYGLNKIFKK